MPGPVRRKAASEPGRHQIRWNTSASAQAIGGLLAGTLVARIALTFSPRVLFAGGLIGLGPADLGMANAASFAPPGPGAMIAASGFMLLAGFPVVAAFAAGHGLLQTLTADAYRGRVFGALGAAQGMATLVGLALGGAAIDVVGVVPVLSVGAVMWAVGGVFALVRLPGGDENVSVREQGTATL